MDPASIKGWNTGALAVEMLGNFDTGHDKFTGKQAQAIYEFAAEFCKLKNLSVDNDIKFHRDNPTAGKTCPGSGISREWFMTMVKQVAGPSLQEAVEFISGRILDGLDVSLWTGTDTARKAQWVDTLLIKIAKAWKGDI
jgi:hypothetical protein